MLAFCHVVLWFSIYSFIGWAYESLLCSITEKKPVNRGFLNGPVCPIYGFGALLVIWILSPAKENILILFLAAMVVTMVLEYITSYLLEKLFHTHWWDYSHLKFNLNGRICLLGALVFGAFSVLLLRWVHPFVAGLVAKIPKTLCISLGFILLAIFLADTVVTVISILKLNQWLKAIQLQLNKLKDEASEHLQAILNKIQDKKELLSIDAIKQNRFYQHMQNRLMHAFPAMTSTRYAEALDKIKELLSRIYEKK